LIGSTRVAASLKGLNSSLAQSPGELRLVELGQIADLKIWTLVVVRFGSLTLLAYLSWFQL